MDCREFIDILKRRGQLVEVSNQVDWNLEASAFSMMMGRTRSQAMLFNKVKGYSAGYRMVTGLFAGPPGNPYARIALALGLNSSCTRKQFSHELLHRMSSPLKPVEIVAGPCKEVIKTGREANLFDFPWPVYAQGDAGRYSVVQAHVCKDPDSDWVNWANYRAMMYSRNRYVIGAQVGAQFDEIFIAKYLARNRSMPVATVIGGDPLVFWVAGMALPPGVSEADVAGGLRQAPLELVKCETSDLLVPADAEIVIEGEVRPREYLPEGPLSESSLFQANPRLPSYAVRVSCITHRRDPIVPVLGLPGGCDIHGMIGVFNVAWDAYARHGLGLPVAAGGASTIGLPPALALKPAYSGMLRDAADRAMHTGSFSYVDGLLLVDEDVDPHDSQQMLETVFTQLDPMRDIWSTDNDWPKIVAMGPYLDEADLKRNSIGSSVVTTKKIFDATSKGNPLARRISLDTCFPHDTRRDAEEQWRALGFDGGAPSD